MKPNKTNEICDSENLSYILKSMFNKDEIICMIGQPRFSSLRKTLVDQVITQIAESMNVEKSKVPAMILGLVDEVIKNSLNSYKKD